MWRKQNSVCVCVCVCGGTIIQKKKYTRDRQLPESLADSRQLSSDRRTGGLCLRLDDKNWLFAINDEVRSKERRLKDKEKKNESGGERDQTVSITNQFAIASVPHLTVCYACYCKPIIGNQSNISLPVNQLWSDCRYRVWACFEIKDQCPRSSS